MPESKIEVARQVYAEKIIMVITVMMTRKCDGNHQLQSMTLRLNDMQI